MPDTNEAMKIWKALRPMIDKEIAERTASCVRAKKLTVTRANETGADGSVKLKAKEPYGDEIEIPSDSRYDDVNPGSPIWVQYYFNNASTMHVACNGDGTIGKDGGQGGGGGDTPPDAIVSLGPASASGGVITIPYVTASGETGSVNFNIADTQYYINGVAAVSQSGGMSLNGSYAPIYFPSNQSISLVVTGTLTNGNTIGGTVLITGGAVQDAYNAGWNAALDAAQAHTCYTGTVRQLYDDSLDVYVNAVNPYQERTYYSLPDRK